MHYTDGNHHKTGYLSSLRKLSVNQVSHWPMMETLAFVSILLKLGGRKSKLSENEWIELFTVTFGKSSFLVTQSRERALCRYSAKTYRMYHRHRSHHKTPDFSCSLQVLEYRLFEWPIIDEMRFASYRTKLAKCTTRMEITTKHATWAFRATFRKSSFSKTPNGENAFSFLCR